MSNVDENPNAGTTASDVLANHAVACMRRESWVQTYTSRDEAGMPIAFEFRCADGLNFWLAVPGAAHRDAGLAAQAIEALRRAEAHFVAIQQAEESRGREHLRDIASWGNAEIREIFAAWDEAHKEAQP